MFSATDTIVAIATPAGRGGIGVVRISGPDADAIARTLTARDEPFEPRHATLATIYSAATTHSSSSVPSTNNAPIDRAIVTSFVAPHSYTGEAVVEISAHGSPVVLRQIVAAALSAGARMAAPGEFTLRAFLNGRIDLAQAEAIGDLIDAASPLQARAAFDQLNGTLTERIAVIDRALFDLVARLEASVDFPDEGYHFVAAGELARELTQVEAELDDLLRHARRGRVVREGLTVAIVGAPNAGKSSLFNALLGTDRAIVTPIPGTTRDMVSESIDIEGVPVTLVDTAGLRDTDDQIEAEGVVRSRRAADVADVILVVSDSSQARVPVIPFHGQSVTIEVAAKADLAAAWRDDSTIAVSALTGEGLDALRARIAAIDPSLRETPVLTNVRHIALVERAKQSVARAIAATSENELISEEFVLADLQEARIALEEVTGKRTSDDVLAHIFEKFCIGK